jgi:hypothetical protein
MISELPAVQLYCMHAYALAAQHYSPMVLQQVLQQEACLLVTHSKRMVVVD